MNNKITQFKCSIIDIILAQTITEHGVLLEDSVTRDSIHRAANQIMQDKSSITVEDSLALWIAQQELAAFASEDWISIE